jgi:hypothetical protein
LACQSYIEEGDQGKDDKDYKQRKKIANAEKESREPSVGDYSTGSLLRVASLISKIISFLNQRDFQNCGGSEREETERNETMKIHSCETDLHFDSEQLASSSCNFCSPGSPAGQ